MLNDSTNKNRQLDNHWASHRFDLEYIVFVLVQIHFDLT